MQNNQRGGTAACIGNLQAYQVRGTGQGVERSVGVEAASLNNQFQKNVKDNKKDELIQKLENSNRIITNEVQIIWEKLKGSSNKEKKPRKIINTQLGPQSLEKELKNAYHLIKIIEKQIDRYQKKQKSSREAFDRYTIQYFRMKQVQDHLNAKEALAFQLRTTLLTKQKESKQLDKQIIAIQSRDTTAQLRAMTQELNSLYQTLKEAEKREEDKLRNLKKQFEEIKKIEKELAHKGMNPTQLEQIKKKAIIEVIPKPIAKDHNQSSIKEPSNQSHQSQKQQQKRSRKRYDEMIYEINVLKKKQKEFQQQFAIIDAQKRKHSQSNKQIQQRIYDCQTEIESLENLSEKLRSKHLFRHRKKQKMRSLEMKKAEEQKLNQVKLNRQKLKQSYQKRSKRYKSLPSSTIKTKKDQSTHKQLSKQNLQIQTHQTNQYSTIEQTDSVEEVLFKEGKNDLGQREQKDIAVFNIEGTEQATTQSTISKSRSFKYGEGSPNCNKFNDRYILGQEHANKKVIELTLYFQSNMLYVSGVSVVYQGGVRGGDYVWRTATESQTYKIQRYQCAEGYIRDIYAQFEQRQQQMMLIGVEIELSNGQRRQFGRVYSYRSKLTEKQYISCISGSMSLHEDKGRINSVIEQLAMTILMI